MNKEEFKFRYYNGEKECPINEYPFKDAPAMVKTFWSLEQCISNDYKAEDIIENFNKVFVKGSNFYSEYLENYNVSEEEKAVLVMICVIVDQPCTGVSNNIVDMYFSYGNPHKAILKVA